MFTVDSNYQIQQPTSQFFASQLINLEWVQPGERRASRLPGRRATSAIQPATSW